MDEIASTKAQANDHPRRLREERGIRGDGNNISDSVVSSLDEALKLLFYQHYTTPTHFLPELIQNADDNTYPQGAVRNITAERNIRERLKYTALLLEDANGTPTDFSSLRISSVPSIAVTMSIDDKLVTIDDSENTIDIYLREGIDQAHRPLLTFEYVEYFKKLMKFTTLINLLMGAPIQSLPRILEQHDILVPSVSDNSHDDSSREDADVSDNGQTLVNEKDAPHGDDCESRSGNIVDCRRVQHPHVVASAPTNSGTDISRKGGTEQENRPSSPPMRLRELIPSHQSRYNSSTSGRHNPFHTSQIPRPDDASEMSEMRIRETGFLGEHFIYEMFAHQIADWTFENWTSRFQSEAGHPPFSDHERDHSDLTYVDTTGRMRAVLREAGVEPNLAWPNTTTIPPRSQGHDGTLRRTHVCLAEPG